MRDPWPIGHNQWTDIRERALLPTRCEPGRQCLHASVCVMADASREGVVVDGAVCIAALGFCPMFVRIGEQQGRDDEGRSVNNDPRDRRAEFFDFEWQQGRLLMTALVQKWHPYYRDEAEARERRRAFAFVSSVDDGRGRVCLHEFETAEQCRAAVDEHNAALAAAAKATK